MPLNGNCPGKFKPALQGLEPIRNQCLQSQANILQSWCFTCCHHHQTWGCSPSKLPASSWQHLHVWIQIQVHKSIQQLDVVRVGVPWLWLQFPDTRRVEQINQEVHRMKPKILSERPRVANDGACFFPLLKGRGPRALQIRWDADIFVFRLENVERKEYPFTTNQR